MYFKGGLAGSVIAHALRVGQTFLEYNPFGHLVHNCIHGHCMKVKEGAQFSHTEHNRELVHFVLVQRGHVQQFMTGFQNGF